jgi:hypothetical protein
MTRRRRFVVAAAGFAVLVVLALAWPAYWERQQPVFENAPKLIAALQAFSREQLAHGRPLPPEIPLRELIVGGFLTSDDVRVFEGIELTFFTGWDETQPQSILASARMRDGHVTCVMADGSVQGFSQSRYEQYLRSLKERGAPTNHHPIRLQTDAPPAGADSRR